MKRLLISGLIILLLMHIVACKSSNNEMESKKNIENQKTETYDAGTYYQNPDFDNIEEAIEWIQTIDVETFQSGRYKNGITSLRQFGKILMPLFPNLEMPNPKIVIMPDDFYPDEKTVLGFYYYMPNQTVAVFTKQINEKYKEKANNEGINSYLNAQFGNMFSPQTVSQVSITQNNLNFEQENNVLQNVLEETSQNISYTIVEDTDPSNDNVTQMFFLSGDFEVKVMQYEHELSQHYLSKLYLQEISLVSNVAKESK